MLAWWWLAIVCLLLAEAADHDLIGARGNTYYLATRELFLNARIPALFSNLLAPVGLRRPILPYFAIQ